MKEAPRTEVTEKTETAEKKPLPLLVKTRVRAGVRVGKSCSGRDGE